ALAAGADAVHPGYGFLAESPRLARACDAAGLVFIGPTAGQLDVVGDKLAARAGATAAGVPAVPGGAVRRGGATGRRGARGGGGGGGAAAGGAERIGWRVVAKGAGGAGGGGLGAVAAPAKLEAAIERATAEADAAFGDPRVYLERLVTAGRHVEVQLLGDGD